MAEWSKAVDLSSTGRKSAWVRTPLLALTAIAQLVERTAFNRVVVGSSPTGGVKKQETETFVVKIPNACLVLE